MVYDNSKEILQSRIKQLNNNFSSSKDDIRKATFKNRVTNEYVNLLSSEVTQKLGSNTSAKIDPLASVELLKANDAIDNGAAESPLLFQRPSNLKTVELLKPLGECKRCNKTITAIDRVTVSGQSYHKYV